MQYLAYTGWFDGVLSNDEVEQAKKGYLPSYLDVHHIFPLAGASSEDVNSFTNLTVLHKTTHKAINHKVFEPQLRDIVNMQSGATKEIWIPVFKPVDAGRIVALRAGCINKRRWQHIKYPPLRQVSACYR